MLSFAVLAIVGAEDNKEMKMTKPAPDMEHPEHHAETPDMKVPKAERRGGKGKGEGAPPPPPPMMGSFFIFFSIHNIFNN